MARSVTPRRRTHDEISSDGEESESDRRKRRSTTSHPPSSARSPPRPNGSLSQRERMRPVATSVQTLVHQPGSIVRVKLVNFVTYTAVEIFPGPSLNMVIGPNGTGKSTLICAICLGLGWPPKHLGRQKEYSEFVKNGEREASIEIELCRGPARTRNPVIRCELKREGSKAEFYINGTKTSQKNVQSTARKFSIQIDNLCQFLPQDKVVEFAAMSPIELLRSTQEAVGSKKMLKWHDELKSLRMEQKEKERSRLTFEATLANLEGRQRMQEADVARMREREQVKEKVRLWKSIRHFAEFYTTKKEWERDKARHSSASRELEALEKDLEPTLRAANSKAAYLDSIKTTVMDRKKRVDAANQDAQNCQQKVDELDEKIKQSEATYTADKKEGKALQMEKSRHANSINDLKKRIAENPPVFDATSHNEKINSRNRKINEIGTIVGERSQNMGRLRAEMERKAEQVARAKADLVSLDTKAGQQANKLARVSSDMATLWKWVKEHPDEFEKEVYGPPLVECSIKDARYTALVEALFQSSSLIAITVQSRRDFEKLQSVIHGQLKLHNVSIREVSTRLERYTAPASEQEMRDYGFDGWALDFVDGPEPILSMLCDDIKLHQSGVSLQDTSPDQYSRIESSNVSSWVTKKSLYRIARRREYGPNAVSTTVRDIRPAQHWTDQPVDFQAKRDIQQRIVDCGSEQERLKEEYDDCRTELKKAQEESVVLKEEVDACKRDKERAQKTFSEHKALPTRLEQLERKLSGVEKQMTDLRVRIHNNTTKQDEYLLSKGQAALDYVSAVEIVHGSHDDLFQAELMLIEATSDHDVLVERNKHVQNQLQERRREVHELEKSSQETKRRAAEQQNRCKAIKEKADSEQDGSLSTFIAEHGQNTSTEKADAEVAAEQARLELMHEGNGRIIEEFEDRERKITDYRERLQSVKSAIQEKDSYIKDIRSSWEPKLDNLVKRISDAFAFNMKQINCAGEVGIDKDEDFDRWAVKIQVKFREEESLTQLDSHRQSGGERAVSTIFYLMSLQSLARSPFRVVDEINQGMDPRNERLVHSRMVAIATGNDEWLRHYQENLATSHTDADDGLRNSEDDEQEDVVASYKTSGGGSQYFLITPKLLHGLRYEPGMKVLCIASGEFMPSSQSQASFSKSLEIRKSMKLVPAVG